MFSEFYKDFCPCAEFNHFHLKAADQDYGLDAGKISNYVRFVPTLLNCYHWWVEILHVILFENNWSLCEHRDSFTIDTRTRIILKYTHYVIKGMSTYNWEKSTYRYLLAQGLSIFFSDIANSQRKICWYY